MRPLQGFCFIELDSLIAEEVGGIVIPDEARQAAGYAGTVLDANPAKNQAKDLVGRRVLTGTGRGQVFHVDHRSILKYPIADIVALLNPDCDIQVNRIGAYGVRRCRNCKSKGEANMMLDGDGMCPTCGIDDRTGKPFVAPEVKLSEDEYHHMGELPEDYIPKGTVMSSKHFKKRS